MVCGYASLPRMQESPERDLETGGSINTMEISEC